MTAAAEPHPERWIELLDDRDRVLEVRNPITRSVARLAHPIPVELFPEVWPRIVLYLHWCWTQNQHTDPKIIEVAP